MAELDLEQLRDALSHDRPLCGNEHTIWCDPDDRADMGIDCAGTTIARWTVGPLDDPQPMAEQAILRHRAEVAEQAAAVLLARLEAAEARATAWEQKTQKAWEQYDEIGMARYSAIKAEAEVVRLREHADALAEALQALDRVTTDLRSNYFDVPAFAECNEAVEAALRAYEEARGVEHG